MDAVKEKTTVAAQAAVGQLRTAFKPVAWTGEFAATTSAALPIMIDGKKFFLRRQFGLGPELNQFEQADLLPGGAGHKKFYESCIAKMQSVESWTPRISVRTGRNTFQDFWYGQEGFAEALAALDAKEPGYFGWALPARREVAGFGDEVSFSLEKSRQTAEAVKPQNWDEYDWEE